MTVTSQKVMPAPGSDGIRRNPDAGDDAPPNPFAVLKDFPFEQN